MTYDASNRKDIRRAEKAARIAEAERINYLKAAMSTAAGRNWFCDLLEACHLFSDPFTADPLREAYSKGERNVGLRLFSDIIAHCPDYYILMMREANARRIESAILDARDASPELSGGTDAGWDTEGSDADSTGDNAE